MAKKEFGSVKWIRRLLTLPIFVFVGVYIFIVFLKINEPTSGYLPTGGINSFYYGFIERMLGEPNGSSYTPPLFIDKSLGFYFGYLGSGPLIAGLTLLAFNKRKKKLFTAGASFFVLHGLANFAPYAIIVGIVILILRFKKSVKHYFNNEI